MNNDFCVIDKFIIDIKFEFKLFQIIMFFRFDFFFDESNYFVYFFMKQNNKENSIY